MKPDTLFYDGDCGTCHRFVRFLLRRDRVGDRFRFAPLHGDAYAAMLPEDVRAALPDTVVLLTAEDEVLIRTAAVRRVLSHLNAPWPQLGAVLGLVPKRLSDWLYDRVAAVRHRLFERPTGSCPVPPEETRDRWL